MQCRAARISNSNLSRAELWFIVQGSWYSIFRFKHVFDIFKFCCFIIRSFNILFNTDHHHQQSSLLRISHFSCTSVKLSRFCSIRAIGIVNVILLSPCFKIKLLLKMIRTCCLHVKLLMKTWTNFMPLILFSVQIWLYKKNFTYKILRIRYIFLMHIIFLLLSILKVYLIDLNLQ